MKEFVEKLTEQLEESRKYNEKMLSNSHDCFSRTVYESQMNTYENSIRIINQLAEEYVSETNVGNINQDLAKKNQDLDKLKQEPRTRIEHIRSMSAEGLADVILKRGEISTVIDFCQNFGDCCETISEEECRKCLINWLNAPVEQKKAIPTEHFETRFNTVV